MKSFISVFTAILAGYATFADVGKDVERGGSTLIQDNYYILVSKLESQSAEIAALKLQQNQLKAQDTNHRAEINQLKVDIATLESQQVPLQAVAFKANLRKNLYPGPNQLIYFDDIQFNLGNAYHLGVFVAPYKGLYLFSVSMCSTGNNYIVVDLVRNGNAIGQVLAGDGSWEDCSSETTITELEAGDDVSVKHHGNSGAYVNGKSYVLNSFTGTLISSL